MKTQCLAEALLLVATTVLPAGATVYTWTADGNGNWNDTSKWSPSTAYPNGTEDEARLVRDITASRTVTQNIAGGVTVRRLVAQDTATPYYNWALSSAPSTAPIRFESPTGSVSIEFSSPHTGNGHDLNCPIILANPLTIENAGSLRIGGSVTSVGSQPVTKRGSGTLSVLTSGFGHTGETIVDAGILAISESGGRLTATPLIRVNLGATVETGSGRGTLVNRIPDTTPVELRGGSLRCSGDSVNYSVIVAADYEKIDELRLLAGCNTIQANWANNGTGAFNTNQVNELIPTRLVREGAATVRVRGRNLGEPFTNMCCRVYFSSSAPTADLVGGNGGAGTTSVSILPYMIGDANVIGAGNTFVTYDLRTQNDGTDVVGLRPLSTATEFVTSLAAAGATDNVRRTSNETLAADASINALAVENGSYTISGNYALTLNSGALLFKGSFSQNLTLNMAALDGNGRELVAHVANSNTSGSGNPNRLIINAVIRNANGLTSGAFSAGGNNSRDVVLNAANTYTGPTTVNGGVLEIGATGRLGSGNLTVRNGGALRQLTASGIEDGATVTLESGATATLSFSGSDTIAKLVVGGTTYSAGGTYGHSSANPTFALDSAFAAGTGLFRILSTGTLITVR